MDLNDIGKIFDNTPMDKVGDVVEFFLDHRDELDRLIALVQSAPAMLTKVADGLGNAGDEAKKAAVSLTGTRGKGGAAGTLTSGSATLTNVGGQLGEAADFLGDVASFMAKVEIPMVEPSYSKVAGVKIVSGIDVGKDKVLADPAKRLTDTASTLTKAKGDLGGLADNLAELAGILTMVGDAIDKLGDGLKDSSAQAAKLFD